MDLISLIFLFLSRWPGILWHLAVQRFEKRDQICPVMGRQLQRLHLLIQVRIGVAASNVEIDHILKCLEAAVVHVRSGKRHIAQGRSLELSSIGLEFCLTEAAKVSEVACSIDSRSGVVKLSIGKEGVVGIDSMADRAIAPLRILEDLEPVDRGLAKRLRVPAVLVLIERRVAAEECTLK